MAQAKGFGSKGLKVARKLFAFQSKGRLVVKLPSDRVEALAQQPRRAGGTTRQPQPARRRR